MKLYGSLEAFVGASNHTGKTIAEDCNYSCRKENLPGRFQHCLNVVWFENILTSKSLVLRRLFDAENFLEDSFHLNYTKFIAFSIKRACAESRLDHSAVGIRLNRPQCWSRGASLPVYECLIRRRGRAQAQPWECVVEQAASHLLQAYFPWAPSSGTRTRRLPALFCWLVVRCASHCVWEPCLVARW